MDRDLDRSRADGTRAEDRINNFVKEFENATDKLRTDYRNNDRANGAVREVLSRGKTIDKCDQPDAWFCSNSKSQWNSLRNDLDQLARLYRVSWNWEIIENLDLTIKGENEEGKDLTFREGFYSFPEITIIFGY